MCLGIGGLSILRYMDAWCIYSFRYFFLNLRTFLEVFTDFLDFIPGYVYLDFLMYIFLIFEYCVHLLQFSASETSVFCINSSLLICHIVIFIQIILLSSVIS